MHVRTARRTGMYLAALLSIALAALLGAGTAFAQTSQAGSSGAPTTKSKKTRKKASVASGSSAAATQPPQKGMVWVNTTSKVYHREGDRYYGKTKHGKYMTEADAIKAGYKLAKPRHAPKAKPKQ